MKTKRPRIFALILALSAALILHAGCSNGSGSGENITYYTVTFDSDGGSYVSEQNVEKGRTAREPNAPTKAGYTFEGWYYGVGKFDFSTPITSSIRLTANWKKNDDVIYYTVIFSVTGTDIDPQTVESGTTATEPDIPVLDGYIFEGWYDGDTLFDFSTPITKDITLSARWKQITNEGTDNTDQDNTESDIDDNTVVCTLYTTEMFSKDFANGYGYIYTIRLLGAWRSVELSAFGRELQAISNRRITLDLTQITETTSIDKEAFQECESIVSIKIGGGVTEIGEYAFYKCEALENITIGDNVTEISSSAFSGCSGYTVTLGENLVSNSNLRPSSRFENCKTVVIKDGVTFITSYAFKDCSSLESITIPNSVIRINDEAFYNCSSLESIIIPDSVKYITTRVFYNCSSLITITFNGTTTQWSAIDKGEDWNYKIGTNYVRCNDGYVNFGNF